MGNFYVRARITFKSTEDGGRHSACFNGYRPNHVFEPFELPQMMRTHIGEITFEEGDKILPGESKEVTVMFLDDSIIRKYIQVGRKWWIHEGQRCVGEGQILSI